MASSSGLNNKFFGNCNVEWRIENFSIQTKDITQKWLIESPEFTINGSERTNWCMNIRSKLINANKCVMFSLRRLAVDSSPKCIRLNLEMFCVYDAKNVCYINDKLLSLEKGSKYEICLGSLEYLLSEMDRVDDSFTILCFMIVYSNDGNKESGECNNAGLKLLSKNMLDLYRSTQNFDTKLLFVDNNIILAHRPILCARNNYLFSVIIAIDDDDEMEEDREYTIVSLPDRLTYEGMWKILPYLYTGDIRYVLGEPSFAVKKCASFLRITEIETHYEPDSLFLRSTVDLQEYIYILREYKFEDSRLIWNFNAEKSTKTYQLLLCPKNDHSIDYTPLFTKTSDEPITTYLDFDFGDKSGHLFTVSLVAIKDTFIDIDDLIGRILQKRHCSHNAFEVVIKLKLTSGVKISCIDSCINVCISYVNEDFYYEHFQTDMAYLFDAVPFRDILIHINGTYFHAHKCILASRVQFFSDLFLTNEEGEVTFSDIDPHIFSKLLTYIYANYLCVDMDDDYIEVYKAAVLLRLPFLQSMCSNMLEYYFKTNRSIRCRVVRIAEEYQDAPLMKVILNYLFERKDTIVTPNRLFSLQDVHTCRYC